MTAPAPTTAFVLGGGGVLGATHVGMLSALMSRGITPDIVVGTSVGAINGAFVAADPGLHTVGRLERLWTEVTERGVLLENPVRQAARFARSRTHLVSADPLREILETHLPVTHIENLVVPFQCVAAEIEGSRSRWFDEGPLVGPILASCAVPGLFAPVEIDGLHYLDGGLVHSIPVGRALQLGARRVFVLQVGRVENRLEPPKTPWELGLVAFEIVRRHRFVEEIEAVPDDVELHVLPSGVSASSPIATLRVARGDSVPERIERAREATLAHLDKVGA
ncbi:patatin-like phospholipase family protein [Janibacter massiliensis]|uniref:patatin-like phospholipase family protein n=1 Tax=Janibacter massiliensis TaxID=2058291 RepID=UPI000D0EFF00|nr:patatin-like phospholipase family protein [Janibacter massiliensis]